MKKLVVLLLAFVLCVSLGACGNRQKTSRCRQGSRWKAAQKSTCILETR